METLIYLGLSVICLMMQIVFMKLDDKAINWKLKQKYDRLVKLFFVLTMLFLALLGCL